MTDWTKKKSRKKYVIIPVVIISIAVFFLAFDVTPNIAIAKPLSEIQDLSQIKALESETRGQLQEVSQMIRNGTDQNTIDSFITGVTANFQEIRSLVSEKKADFEKREIAKNDWKQKRFSDDTIIQAEIDCPNHPMKPGHLVLDPNLIEDAIYERCFAEP